MKTLKHNLVVAMLAICIATVTASAQKSNKVAKGSVVRARLLDLLSGSDIHESGLADIFFKLENNHISILNVEGSNSKLNKQIMTWLDTNDVYLNGEGGDYQVTINMNGAKASVGDEDAKARLRAMIAEIMNHSDIEDKGAANIMFCISDKKHLKVLDVTGSDNYLSAPVKNMINDAEISVPEGLKGKYEVNVTF
jgi:acid stress-induced BolA-like protein IbaG/YrbA